MSVLVSSYSEANRNNEFSIGLTTNDAGSQAFTADGGNLYSVKFYLTKSGSPTGNAVAKLYAQTGTSGSTSVPTGSALATSDNLDVSTIVAFGNYNLFELLFTGVNQVALTASTIYCVTLEYAGPADDVNFITAGFGSTSPADNLARHLSGVWTPLGPFTMCFYLYKTDAAVSAIKVGSLLAMFQ